MAAGLLALTRRPPRQIAMASVNGALGLVLRDADGVLSVISVTVDGGRIAASTWSATRTSSPACGS